MDWNHDISEVTTSSSKSTTSTDVNLTTLKSPINPPCRRSSLGFSKIVANPVDESQGKPLPEQSPKTRSNSTANTSKKRAAILHRGDSAHVSPRLPEDREPFGPANAILHVDMHYAASPDGSIDSRLLSHSTPITERARQLKTSEHSTTDSPSRWRYSTVPSVFAAVESDVREPIATESPGLPQSKSWHRDLSTPCHEPPSSGHVSLTSEGSDAAYDLPPLPSSSPPPLSLGRTNSPPLEHQMMDLEVASNDSSVDERAPLMKDPCQSNHSDARPNIFMSSTAKAAADHARQKRGVANNEDIQDNGIAERHGFDAQDDGPAYTQVAAVRVTDPGPGGHRTSTPCPDPLAHFGPYTPEQPAACYQAIQNPHVYANHSYLAYRPPARVTTAGSPMPVAKLHTDSGARLPHRRLPPNLAAPVPAVVTSRPSPQRVVTDRQAAALTEHFQPGWYYTDNSPQVIRDKAETYSFSTAAAKASGESAAPDSRIRDSYRTDTLTPLAKPPSRFRKNGIGAEVQLHNERKLYNTPSIGQRNAYQGIILGGRPTMRSPVPQEFRSSPPKHSDTYLKARGIKRGRNRNVHTPDTEFGEECSTDSHIEVLHDHPVSNGTTATAIRQNMFGSETTGGSQTTDDVIQELSPNVRIWRRGVGVAMHTRKKRRPSYWDGDLEEVKMSPAGRRGVASSPIMSKTSMVAEVESVSCQGSMSDANDSQYSSDVENYSLNTTQSGRGSVMKERVKARDGTMHSNLDEFATGMDE